MRILISDTGGHRCFRLFAIAIAAVLTGGCATVPGAPSVPPAPEPTTVVWLADPIAETATNDVRQVLKDAFEEAYPSISLQLMTGPTTTNQLRSTLVRRLSSGATTPDVYDTDVVWQYDLAARGYSLPLSDYLPASYWSSSGSASESGASAAFDQAMKYKGSYYGVPEYIDEGFLYYRKDLLDRAGLQPPRTWEQLEKDSLVLKRKGLAYQFAWQGSNYEGLTCDWYEFMTDAFGNKPPSAMTPAQELDSPQALKALEFMRGLIGKGISPRNVNTFTETSAENAFAEGNVAFLRGWDDSYADTTNTDSKLTQSQVGVELPPSFQGEPGPSGWSALGGWGLAVNSRTKHLKAALTFVKWLAGQQAQWILATQYSLIPGNAAIRTDPAVTSLNPVLSAAARARVVARPSQEKGYAAISADISGAVYRALPGPGTPGGDPCRLLTTTARELDPGTSGGLTCPASPGRG